MFFKKDKKEILQEAPLGYWEEKSYMIIIPENEGRNPLVGIFERIEDIKEVEILEKREMTEKEPGYIKIKYQNEEYEMGFYPTRFNLQEFYLTTAYRFNEEEKEKLKNTHIALTIYMTFQKDRKKSYHLQLKLANAIIPDMLALMDESAEKMLPARWVEMAAESKIVPSANDLYTIQAVTSKQGEVWLHTHGLCRCGLTELEILNSDEKNHTNHYNLISTFASYLIDNEENDSFREKGVYLGVLSNRTPVVATYMSWTKALNEYQKLKVGDKKDRESGHNSKTSVIFLYQNEQDEKEHKVSKVSIYNDLWGENPIFFISDEETARMKALAIERFDLVKEQFENKDNQIIIKIGLKTDLENSDELEHIWFELLEFKEDKFKAKLIQEPYNVKDIHTGDELWFSKEDITDWIIYTKEIAIKPGDAYLLK